MKPAAKIILSFIFSGGISSFCEAAATDLNNEGDFVNRLRDVQEISAAPIPYKADPAAARAPESDAAKIDFYALAQRFRPYLKFSRDRGDETIKPCSWQWFFNRSDLVLNGSTILTSTAIKSGHEKILNYAGITDSNNYLPYELIPVSEAVYNGQAWSEVKENGDGIYSHIEKVSDNLISIEYWMLYAYNKTTVAGNHKGDLAAIQMFYDISADRITSAAFSIHGRVIEKFTIPGKYAQLVSLTGKNISTGGLESAAAYKYNCTDNYQDGPYWHSPSTNEIYMVADPVTDKYEHLAVYIEWGAHEPWPNPSGSVRTAPKHTGDSYSFLPDKVHLLNETTDKPFLNYGGKLGDDPLGIKLHRSWYQKTDILPDAIRVDRNPY